MATRKHLFMQKCSNLEASTDRLVSMRTERPPSLSYAFHQQRQSPLLQLPPAVRLNIFELALAGYEDDFQAYSSSAPFYREGYKAPVKVETALLLTCRSVWIDAHYLPVKLATHTFWFAHRPKDRNHLAAQALGKLSTAESVRFNHFFTGLTPLNCAHIRGVRIFASQPWLYQLADYSEPRTLFRDSQFTATNLTFTIRDIDWVGAYHSDRYWLVKVLSSQHLRHLRTIKLELEKEVADKANLKSLAEGFMEVESKHFKCIGEIKEHHWTRSSLSDLEPTTYCVLTIEWRNTKAVEKQKRLVPCKEGAGLHKFYKHPVRRAGKRSQTGVNPRKKKLITMTETKKRERKRQNEVAKVMSMWMQKGSLLTLVEAGEESATEE